MNLPLSIRALGPLARRFAATTRDGDILSGIFIAAEYIMLMLDI